MRANEHTVNNQYDPRLGITPNIKVMGYNTKTRNKQTTGIHNKEYNKWLQKTYDLAYSQHAAVAKNLRTYRLTKYFIVDSNNS